MSSKIGQVVLDMKSVSKSFPGTLAVDAVDFQVKAGEVHALMGENGAGKSTLMKMLAGSFDDYTGDIVVNGQSARLTTPLIAKQHGIGMIYQELSLAKPLSVAENMLVGQLPRKGLFIDKTKMIEISKDILKRVGLEYIDPTIEISEISQHEAQLVEIGKALYSNPSILVMDEPTSALSSEEVKRLFTIINGLKEQGMAIIYISHHLPEVFEIADRVTVMRDGKKVSTNEIENMTSSKLVEMMVGQKIDKFYTKRDANIGEIAFEAKNLSRWGFFHNVSFHVSKGEILGICGLAGAGRSELACSIIGIDPIDEGEMIFEGQTIKNKNMQQAMKRGMAYLTENRKLQGLALRLSMSENILSSMIPELTKGLYFSKKDGNPALKQVIEDLQIYPAEEDRMVSNFSGGNQQKILLGKWLALKPRLLILDEPTRGVDIGAKMLIHKTIEKIANEGHSIILISSDLPELVGLSDRAMIMREGKFIGELSQQEINEDALLLAANGEGGMKI
ncbi:MAG: sugar ABC transporter ATP-binding protein [Christensenellaceae bacterium]